MADYRAADEVRDIATELIGEHHSHLLGVRVQCVFVDKTPKSKGREVWARAKKVSGLNAFLADAPGNLPKQYEDQPPDFFVIEVAEEIWRRLSHAARRALIDEQLCSCEIEEDEETGSVSLAVVGPDVSGFQEVVRRHGLWREDLRDFVRAGAEQLSIDDAVKETGVVAEDQEPVRGQVESWNFSPAHARTLEGAAKHLRGIDGGHEVDPETGEVLAGVRSE